MSSGYQEPVGGTASPSTGTAVGSKPIRAWLKVLRNVDIVAEPDYGSNFIPKIKTPFELLASSLRLHNPAQTFYTNVESAALLANQSIKVPIITATETGNKKDEVVLLKQSQSLENKTFPTYVDVTETAAPANPSAGTLRIYANSTTHELTQRNSAGVEVKLSDGTGGGGGGGDVTGGSSLGAGVAVFKDETTGVLRFKSLNNGSIVTVAANGDGNTVDLGIASGSIVDSQIGSHTSTKISITAKGQLNTAILYSDVDNALGSHYVDVTERAAPSNPSAGVLRIYANSTTHELTQRDSSGTEKKFSDGSGGGGAPTTSQYLTLASDATLTSERTLTASSRVTLTDAGANSTATLDIGTGSIVDAYIGTHTSTKISITAKGQLNSQIAYKDETVWLTNAMVSATADIAWTKILKTGSIYDDIGDVTITTAAAQDIIQRNSGNTAWINLVKGSNNTFLGVNGSGVLAYSTVADANIASHTSTKISITAKGQLNSAILYNDQNNSFGAFYHDITEIAAPANPSAGTLRIYTNSTTHELTQRDSTGAEKKMSDGSGGGGAPTTSQYLTLATDGSLSNERVLTASSRVTLTDAGAGSTATLDIGAGSIVDSQIGTHTSTKISITAKGQLNSQIGYKDETLWLTNAMIADATIDLASKGVKGSGTSLQVLRVNTGATALEWATPSSGSTTPYMTAADYTITKEGANYNAYASLGTSAAFTNTALHTLLASVISALSTTGGVIEFARNTVFSATNQIIMANNVYFRGQDRITTVLRQQGAFQLFRWDTGSGGAALTNAGITDMHIKLHDGVTDDKEAIYCSGSVNFRLNRCWIESMQAPTNPTIATFFDTKNLVNFHKYAEFKDNWYSGDNAGQDMHGSGNMYNCILTGNTFFNHIDGQCFGSASPFYCVFANNTFINTGKIIGFEDVCEYNVIANNTAYNTGSIKLSGENGESSSVTANVSRNNIVIGNVMVYGASGIEMGNCYYDEVVNNKIIRSTMWGIYGSCYRCTIRGNSLVDTNTGNTSHTVNSVATKRGGITLFNNPSNQADSDENIIEQNRLIDTAASFTDPVTSTTVSGHTGPIVISTNYDKTKIMNNNYIGIESAQSVYNYGTHTFFLQTEGEALQIHSDEADQFQVYRMINTNLSRAGMRVDMNDSASTRAQYGAAEFVVSDNTAASKDSYFGVKYQVGNSLAERFYTYNNHIGFGGSTTTSVELKTTNITGGLKVWTFPNATDNFVGEAVTQPLTNKTINFSSNTGSNIGDSAIAAHTSTKITITTKGQLNSSLLYGDQNNSLGAFYTDIGEIAAPGSPAANFLRLYMDNGDESLRVKNSGGTVFNLFSPTGLVDANIGTHTSTKISITSKSLLNSAIVYNDQANTFGGANNQTIPIANLLLSNNSNTGAFGVQASLTGTRVWSMPNSSTNVLGHDTTDTVSNKTLSGYKTSRRTETASTYTAVDTDTVIECDATSASQTISLPAVSGRDGKRFTIMKIDSTANTVTIDPNASETINGATTYVLSVQYQAVTLFCNGSSWRTAGVSSERAGTATATGDGTTTVFNIAHGIGATPSNAFVQCRSLSSAFTWTKDASNLVVTFGSAPANATSLVFEWRAIA